jgi:HEPN domain-containing protein
MALFELWLAQAARDLLAARTMERGGFHEWAHYCCQQAAEKALKAYFVALGVDIPREHDLLKLSNPWRGAVEQARPELGLAFSSLNSDTKDFKDRYPADDSAPFQIYDGTDSADAIQAAEQVLGFCDELARKAWAFKKSIQ